MHTRKFRFFFFSGLLLFLGYVFIVVYSYLENRIRCLDQLDTVQRALDLYCTDTGSYPSLQQGISALYRCPVVYPYPDGWKGPYLKEEGQFVPNIDPWGTFFVYCYEENRIIIKSLGADRKEGGILWGHDMIKIID